MTIEATRQGPRDYAAFMECSADNNWFPDVDAQLSSWLRNKGFDVDLSQDLDQELGRSRLLVRRHRSGGGSEVLVELTEDGGKGGIWHTELVAHNEPGGRGWISLVVSNDHGKYVAVPWLARYLMQVLPLGDSTLTFTDKSQHFGVNDVDHLIDVLVDQSRHGLVFVAGTSEDGGIDLARYERQIDKWAKEVFGLAQVIVLDPAATAMFEQSVGSNYAAPPWTIRTYQPQVRFDDPVDARRHRILGTRRLATQTDRSIEALLGDVARGQAATRPVDPQLLRARRTFSRLENRRLVEQLSQPIEAANVPPTQEDSADALLSVAPPDPVEIGQATHPAVDQVGLVKKVLGLKEITEQALWDFVTKLAGRDAERARAKALQERIDLLQTRAEQAEDERDELRTLLDDSQLETQVALLDVDDSAAKVRWLEARLKEKGDYDVAFLPVPDEFIATRPGNFEELLDRIESLKGVQFTGEVSYVERLNQIDTNGAALRAAWDAVLALSDYGRARREGQCAGSLDGYLKSTPSGYATFPPGKFAETETAVTMQQFGTERVFPVPRHVSPSEQITMKAHFKLARIGMASPRMYIHDGHPQESMVYIGYLGCHPTNTHTN